MSVEVDPDAQHPRGDEHHLSHIEESLFARLRREYGLKAAKYVAVSVVNVVFGQTLLVVLKSGFGLGFGLSNLIAVAVSAVPAYVLSRRWIWQKSGRSHFMKEVVPFWGLAFLGLGFSTSLAYLAGRYAAANDLSHLQEQLLLNGTNLFAFGTLWVVKFFVLDNLLFGSHHHTIEDEYEDGYGPDVEEAVAVGDAVPAADPVDPDTGR